MRFRAFGVLTSAAGLLLSAAAASALSYHTADTIPGIQAAEIVAYEIYGSSESSYAVAFEATLDGVLGVSFCGDLLHSIELDHTYTATQFDYALISPEYEAAAAIANRWSFDLGSLSTSLSEAAAGVQLAIWETIYGADFSVTSASNGTLAVMKGVLGEDYSNGAASTVFLDNTAGCKEKQDHFFTPGDGGGSNPVPEPTAALLFAVGLVVIHRGAVRQCPRGR